MTSNHLYTAELDRRHNIAARVATSIDYCNDLAAGLLPIEGGLIGTVIGCE